MLNKVKQIIKDRVCSQLNMPYSRDGLSSTLLKYIDKDKPIKLMDVGAHNGDFTKALENYCDILKGVLVEPLPEKLELLYQNFLKPKFYVFGCIASSENGIAEFEINEATVTSSLLNIKRDMPELAEINLSSRRIIQCQSKTLDDIAKEVELGSVDLLKLDVQGAEHLVLKGAGNILQKTSMIWTEVSFKTLYEGSSDFLTIYNMLYRLGFKFMEIEPGFRGPDKELLQGDALFIRK